LWRAAAAARRAGSGAEQQRQQKQAVSVAASARRRTPPAPARCAARSSSGGENKPSASQRACGAGRRPRPLGARRAPRGCALAPHRGDARSFVRTCVFFVTLRLHCTGVAPRSAEQPARCCGCSAAVERADTCARAHGWVAQRRALYQRGGLGQSAR
jgi:hypothetical protein